jgi:hypothetical protein
MSPLFVIMHNHYYDSVLLVPLFLFVFVLYKLLNTNFNINVFVERSLPRDLRAARILHVQRDLIFLRQVYLLASY